MVSSKITALDAIAAIVGADLLAVVDDVSGTPTSKKGTVTQLAAFLDDLAETLTNKVIDSDDNTITNIVDADIKAAAAIAVNKLAALTVSQDATTDSSGFLATKKRVISIVKQTTETIQSSETLQDDDELVFAGIASKTYYIVMAMIINSGTTPDFKFAFSVPTGATIIRADTDNTILFRQTIGYDFATDSTVAKFLQTGGNVGQWGWTFMVEMDTTAGDIQYQWAQNTSTASDTSVLRGATMMVFES